jgi:hypothetical protein
MALMPLLSHAVRRQVSIALVVAALAISAARSGMAESPELNGGTLLDWCTSAPGSFGDASCTLYIAGFVHGVDIGQSGRTAGPICLPPEFTPAEARAIFIRVMRIAPIGSERVDVALGAALGSQYPCPQAIISHSREAPKARP